MVMFPFFCTDGDAVRAEVAQVILCSEKSYEPGSRKGKLHTPKPKTTTKPPPNKQTQNNPRKQKHLVRSSIGYVSQMEKVKPGAMNSAFALGTSSSRHLHNKTLISTPTQF